MHVQDNLFRRVFSYNKKYLKYEKDALEEARSFSFLGCMSRSDRCVKAVVTARRVNAKETFQDMSGELIENRGYF